MIVFFTALAIVFVAILIAGCIDFTPDGARTYQVRCKGCGCIVDEKKELRWLSKFFLPDTCPCCGEYRPEYVIYKWRKINGEWVIEKEFKPRD